MSALSIHSVGLKEKRTERNGSHFKAEEEEVSPYWSRGAAIYIFSDNAGEYPVFLSGALADIWIIWIFFPNMKEAWFQADDILIYALFVPLACSLLQTRSVPLERGKKKKWKWVTCAVRCRDPRTRNIHNTIKQKEAARLILVLEVLSVYFLPTTRSRPQQELKPPAPTRCASSSQDQVGSSVTAVR